MLVSNPFEHQQQRPISLGLHTQNNIRHIFQRNNHSRNVVHADHGRHVVRSYNVKRSAAQGTQHQHAIFQIIEFDQLDLKYTPDTRIEHRCLYADHMARYCEHEH